MMVGTYRQHLACVAAQPNGVKHHRSMKPSSRDPQLGLASPLNYAANKSGKIKIKSPSQKEAGLDVSHQPWLPARGRERLFFLTSSFIARRSRNQNTVVSFQLSAVGNQL
jgi:hypothetical protein